MKYDINDTLDIEVTANSNSGQVESVIINGHDVMDLLVNPDEFINLVFGGRNRFWNRVQIAEFEYNSRQDALSLYKSQRDLELEDDNGVPV